MLEHKNDNEIVISANLGGEISDPYSTEAIKDYRGEELAEVERFPDLGVSDKIELNKEAGEDLREMRAKEVLKLFDEAGNRFLNDELEPGGIGREEYLKKVCKSTGLPVSSVKDQFEMIGGSFKDIKLALEAQSPDGSLEAYDSNLYDNGTNIRAGWIPKGDNLGIIVPKNSPAVISLALIGYGSKFPLSMRPSDQEPFTAARVVDALYKSGAPKDSLFFLPGDYEVGEKVLNLSDLAIGFGSEELERKYEGNSNVKIYGPGNSKKFIEEDLVDLELIDMTIKEGMMHGGRGCINISQVLSNGKGREIADKIAKKMSEMKFKDPLDYSARIPAMDPEEAESWNSFIETNIREYGGEDLSSKYFDGRIVQKEGVTYLRPTVIYLSEDEIIKNREGHPLFTELPFQYMVVADVSEEYLGSMINNSLAVSLATDDKEKIERARKNPSIEKLYNEDSTPWNIDLREPHEGYVGDYLYKKVAR